MSLGQPQPSDRSADRPIEWQVSSSLIEYPAAITFMEQRVGLIAEGRGREAVWLCEHPPLYTAGSSAKPQDLLEPARFPVHATGRGGQFTYHGPGQRVVYVMLDIRYRFGDIKGFVRFLENWIIEVLDSFGVAGEIRQDRVGVWVRRPDKEHGAEDKIAAIGIRLRRWVSYHGLAINVNPDLEHFSGIVPCGIREHGITSLDDLNIRVTLPELDAVLLRTFRARFSDVRTAALSASVKSPDPTPGTATADPGAGLNPCD